MPHRVLLIPGFFAFDAIGDLQYFWGVREAVEAAFARRGEQAVVHEVKTLPTASIRRRAAKVLEAASRLLDEGPGPLHLVGHSTGGLDARLAIAPTARLPTEASSERLLEHTRSIVTVSTPHGGSPLASFFASVAGKPLLRVLTALAAVMLEKGEVPTRAAVMLGDLLRQADDLVGLRGTVLDELYDLLLADLSDDRRARIVALLREIGDDTSLVFQLTPEGVDLLDAATGDPAETAYGCVVTRAPAPSLSGFVARGPNPYAHTLHAVYVLLSAIASRARSEVTLEDDQASLLREAYGEVPGPSDHDGIVPTLSQLWGRLLHAARADHLDVVGHYGDFERRTSDWLPADTGFDRDDFERLWDHIVAFQLASS